VINRIRHKSIGLRHKVQVLSGCLHRFQELRGSDLCKRILLPQPRKQSVIRKIRALQVHDPLAIVIDQSAGEIGKNILKNILIGTAVRKNHVIPVVHYSKMISVCRRA